MSVFAAVSETVAKILYKEVLNETFTNEVLSNRMPIRQYH